MFGDASGPGGKEARQVPSLEGETMYRQKFLSELIRLPVIAVGLWASVGLPTQASNRPAGRPETTSAVSGKITSPNDGEKIDRQITVRGEIANLPKEHHLWLAVKAGAEGLLWLKEPELSISGSKWSQEITQDGPYSLLLLDVPPEGQREIERWLEQGKQSGGDFPGLKSIPGAKTLHTVKALESH
jgi:hypothetical protein